MNLLEKVSIVVTPTGYKAGTLYGAIPSNGDADMDVTRATASTRVDENGLVKYAVGDELVTDGDFPLPNTAWSLGSGWTISDGKAHCDITSSVAFTQPITLVIDSIYFIEFTISNLVVGGFQIQFAGDVIGSGSANGTFSFLKTATNVNETLYCYGLNTSEFSVTNISVKEVTNVPRIDYTGGGCPHVLLEPQSTNQVTYSEDFSQGYWTKSKASIVSNATTSPDGTVNASKLVENTQTGNHYTLINPVYTTSSINNVITLSAFAKKDVRDINLESYASGGGENPKVNFDLTNGTASLVSGTATFSIESFDEDWYRCSITYTVSQSSSDVQMYLFLLNGDNTSYTGDGTSGVYIWGAQFEVLSYATSIIPTDGSTVTRNQDLLTRDSISSLLGQTEGTVFLQVGQIYNNGSTSPTKWFFEVIKDANNSFGISSGGANEAVTLRFVTFIGGVASTDAEPGGFSNSKIAIKYNASEFKLFQNGVLEATISKNIGGYNEVEFMGGGADDLMMELKQFMAFDTVLTDAELVILTS